MRAQRARGQRRNGGLRTPNYAEVFRAYVASLGPVMSLPYIEADSNITRNILYTTYGPTSPGPNIILNDDFADWTGDAPDNYTVTGHSPPNNLVEESPAGECRILSDGDNVNVRQSNVVRGDTYRCGVDISTYVSGAGGFGIEDYGNQLNVSRSAAGSYSYDGIATNVHFFLKRLSACDLSWDNPFCRKIGELDAYVNGATMGATTCLGQAAPSLDGVNDYIQKEYNRLDSVFDESKGSLSIAFRAAGAVLADANTYAICYYGIDTNNRFYIINDGSNIIRVSYRVGGVNRFTTHVIDSSYHDVWNLIRIVWDNSASEFRSYLNDDPVQVRDSWSSAAWPGGLTEIFTQTGAVASSAYFPGYVTQEHLWNKVLTADQVGKMYSLFALGVAQYGEPIAA